MARVIGFGVFITAVILGLAYFMFGISSIVFWASVGGCAVLIWWAYSRHRKLNRIVECLNCHRKMTYKRFKDAGGCPWCGTDLYTLSE